MERRHRNGEPLEGAVGWKTAAERPRHAGTSVARVESTGRAARNNKTTSGAGARAHNYADARGHSDDSDFWKWTADGENDIHEHQHDQVGGRSQSHSASGTIRTLCAEDKARIARLVAQLDQETEAKQRTLAELAESRARFDAELSAITQQHQETALRNAHLQHQLAESETLLMNYRAQLSSITAPAAESVSDQPLSSTRVWPPRVHLLSSGVPSDVTAPVRSAGGTATRMMPACHDDTFHGHEAMSGLAAWPVDVTIHGRRYVPAESAEVGTPTRVATASAGSFISSNDVATSGMHWRSPVSSSIYNRARTTTDAAVGTDDSDEHRPVQVSTKTISVAVQCDLVSELPSMPETRSSACDAAVQADDNVLGQTAQALLHTTPASTMSPQSYHLPKTYATSNAWMGDVSQNNDERLSEAVAISFALNNW